MSMYPRPPWYPPNEPLLSLVANADSSDIFERAAIQMQALGNDSLASQFLGLYFWNMAAQRPVPNDKLTLALTSIGTDLINGETLSDALEDVDLSADELTQQ